jgi:ssDNA-binding Zn-finger/Zn-ribbon topoisomerase 1
MKFSFKSSALHCKRPANKAKSGIAANAAIPSSCSNGGVFMAINTCPECKQEVSSAAPACPHCGYPLQKKAAPLGEIQRHRTIGMVFLALGFAAVFGGLILAFTWSLLSILGALLIIGGSALMSMGYLQTTGFYNVSCPQCGAQGTLSPRARVWKCPQCKCRSLRQGDALEEE